MSALSAALKAPLRLARALVRYGPVEVMRFWLDVIKRRGVVGAFNHAVRKHEPASDVPVSVDVQRKTLAPLRPTQTEWKAWLRQTTPLASGDPLADAVTPIRLHVVCSGGDEARIRTTRTSIEQLDPSALAAPVTIGTMKESLPADPQTWVLFVQCGDQLTADAATRLASAAKGGTAEIVTFDMWFEGEDGVEPVLLPGPNPTLADEVDYTFGRLAVRRGCLPGALNGVSGAAWLRRNARRLSAPTAQGLWRHIGRPILAMAQSPQPVVKRQVERLVRRRSRMAPKVRPGRVSVVICTRDKGWLVHQLIEALLRNPAIAEVVVLANNTTSPHALETLARLDQTDRVIVVRRDEPFNFSRLCNIGSRYGRLGDLLLFMNDDIAPASTDWLERLVARIDRPWVGLAGALLLYPDERIQHAGMFLGYRGAAGHTRRFADLAQDYLFTASAARDVSAVTGAVMLIPRAVFDAVGGFDEMLPTFLQDVDLCLRVSAGGSRVVFEPGSVLFHMESASIRDGVMTPEMQSRRTAERLWFERRWGGVIDPFHAPGFSLEDEGLMTLSKVDLQ